MTDPLDEMQDRLDEDMARLRRADQVLTLLRDLCRALSDLDAPATVTARQGVVTVELRVDLPVPAKPSAPAAPRPPARLLPDYITGPWSDDELIRLRELMDAGRTLQEMAAALNRSPQGVAMWSRRLTKDDPPAPLVRAVPEPEPEAEPEIEPEPETTPAPLPPEPQAARPCESAAVADPGWSPPTGPRLRRVMAQRIEAAGYDETWTPDTDRQMVEALARGDGAAGAARLLGLDKDAVVARWQAFGPGASVEAQAALLQEVRARAGVQA